MDLNKIPEGKIVNKKVLTQFLEYERVRYRRKSTRMPLICVTESDFLWKHNVLYRKTEYFINTRKKLRGLIYKIFLLRFQNKYSIHIPINVFGCGLKLMHLGPVLVNGRVKAGKNISIHMNTCIVAGGSNHGTPVIDDGVVLGVGAVILGDVYLAKNIAVGANAVVNKSFYEENITIAGVPAKKISDRGRLAWEDGTYQ